MVCGVFFVFILVFRCTDPEVLKCFRPYSTKRAQVSRGRPSATRQLARPTGARTRVTYRTTIRSDAFAARTTKHHSGAGRRDDTSATESATTFHASPSGPARPATRTTARRTTTSARSSRPAAVRDARSVGRARRRATEFFWYKLNDTGYRAERSSAVVCGVFFVFVFRCTDPEVLKYFRPYSTKPARILRGRPSSTR